MGSASTPDEFATLSHSGSATFATNRVIINANQSNLGEANSDSNTDRGDSVCDCGKFGTTSDES